MNFQVFILRASGAFAAFVFNIVIARSLSVDEAGMFFLAITVILNLTVVSRFGFDNLLLRRVSAYTINSNSRAITNLWKKTVVFVSFLSALLTAGLFISANWFSLFLDKPEISMPLRIVSLGILPFALVMIHAEIIKAVQKISLAVFLQVAIIPTISSLFCGLLGYIFGLNGSAIGYLISVNISCIFSILVWRKILLRLRASEQQNVDRIDINLKDLCKESLPFLGIAMLRLAINTSDILLLGIFSDSESVALYSTMSRISVLITFFLSSINSIIAPKFSIYHEKGEQDKLKKLSRESSGLMMLLTAPVFLPLLIFPDFFLGLFGERYLQGVVLLQVLLFGQLVNVLTGPVGYLLMMTGNAPRLYIHLLFITLSKIFLSIYLIPHFGILASSIISAICIALVGLLNLLAVYQKLNFLLIPSLHFLKNGKFAA